MVKYVKSAYDSVNYYFDEDEVDYIGRQVANQLSYIYDKYGVAFKYVSGIEDYYQITDAGISEHSLDIGLEVVETQWSKLDSLKQLKHIVETDGAVYGWVTFYTDDDNKSDKGEYLIEKLVENICEQF